MSAGNFRIEKFEFCSSFEPEPGIPEDMYLLQDRKITENTRFSYRVFVPQKRKNRLSCILLLHGLNERSWDKYLGWAQYLAVKTGKPVILFPLAYHINRAPAEWSNPRHMAPLMEKRKKEAGSQGSLSFANTALSYRLTEKPYRFYNSGRQSITDITELALQIKSGRHPLFDEGTTIDIFGYSIGSFLAEIMLMANPGNLFSSSKLFIFCGGAIFRHMYGESKYIMDRMAYEKLLHFYCDEWFHVSDSRVPEAVAGDDGLKMAFNAMISPDFFSRERESFFSKWKNRLAGVSLRKDKVMPFYGVEACMGSKLAAECFEELDFPFEYSHEAPFPGNGKADKKSLRTSFLQVFNRCAAFLA